ncbi:hypothetical protein CQR41_15525, partial [Enterococcus faecium]
MLSAYHRFSCKVSPLLRGRLRHVLEIARGGGIRWSQGDCRYSPSLYPAQCDRIAIENPEKQKIRGKTAIKWPGDHKNDSPAEREE